MSSFYLVDMATILCYPLTPVPLCFSHIDGTMNKTNKAVLFNNLEKRIKSHSPSSIDCSIIDGMFFLHLLGDLPVSFGKIAAHILKKLCNQRSARIDIIFDRTISPSIKDSERDRRASDQDRNVSYSINGPLQQRPTDFIKALRNDDFKKSLVEFLVESWKDDSFSVFMGNKIVYITHNENCYSFRVRDGKMAWKLEEDLCCQHEEADSRMIFHLTMQPSSTNVPIRTADTDVMAIFFLEIITNSEISMYG